MFTMARLVVVVVVVLTVILATVAQTAPNSTCPGVQRCLRRLDKGYKCDSIPIPEESQTNPFPVTAPYKLQMLREGVWAIVDLVYTAIVIRWKDHVVLLDAPDSPAGLNKPDGSRTRLTDIIETVLNGTALGKLDIVYTHNHFDHIGASRRVVQWTKTLDKKPVIRIFGAANIFTLVNRSVTKRAVVPTHVIKKEGLTLYIRPGLRINMEYVGGHTDRDLAIHIPRFRSESAVLMHVDVVYPGYVPFWTLGITDDTGRYITVHDDLLKYDFDYFVSGHIRVGLRRDVEDSARFAKDLLNAALVAPSLVTQEDRERIGISNLYDPSAREYGNLWFMVITTGRGIEANTCSRIMIEKWGCKLGGIAETIYSNCFTMLTHIGVAY